MVDNELLAAWCLLKLTKPKPKPSQPYCGEVIAITPHLEYFIGYIKNILGDLSIRLTEINDKYDFIEFVDARLQCWFYNSCVSLNKLAVKMYNKYLKLISEEGKSKATAMKMVLCGYDFAGAYWKNFKRKERPLSLEEFCEYVYGDHEVSELYEKDIFDLFDDDYGNDELIETCFNSTKNVKAFLREFYHNDSSFERFLRENKATPYFENKYFTNICGLSIELKVFPYFFDIDFLVSEVSRYYNFDETQELAFASSFLMFLQSINYSISYVYSELGEPKKLPLEELDIGVIQITESITAQFVIELVDYIQQNYPIYNLDKLIELINIGQDCYYELASILNEYLLDEE